MGVESAVGSNLKRLAEFKAEYPDHLFRLNDSVIPGHVAAGDRKLACDLPVPVGLTGFEPATP